MFAWSRTLALLLGLTTAAAALNSSSLELRVNRSSLAYELRVGGDSWLRSSALRVHVGGAWHSEATGTLTRDGAPIETNGTVAGLLASGGGGDDGGDACALGASFRSLTQRWTVSAAAGAAAAVETTAVETTWTCYFATDVPPAAASSGGGDTAAAAEWPSTGEVALTTVVFETRLPDGARDCSTINATVRVVVVVFALSHAPVLARRRRWLSLARPRAAPLPPRPLNSSSRRRRFLVDPPTASASTSRSVLSASPLVSLPPARTTRQKKVPGGWTGDYGNYPPIVAFPASDTRCFLHACPVGGVMFAVGSRWRKNVPSLSRPSPRSASSTPPPPPPPPAAAAAAARAAAACAR